MQPWRFIIARRNDENFDKIKGTLVGFNQAWSPNAAAYIVVLAIGKQAPAEALGEGAIFEREVAPRERIALDELIISGIL